jgi:hypothetical protein
MTNICKWFKKLDVTPSTRLLIRKCNQQCDSVTIRCGRADVEDARKAHVTKGRNIDHIYNKKPWYN